MRRNKTQPQQPKEINNNCNSEKNTKNDTKNSKNEWKFSKPNQWVRQENWKTNAVQDAKHDESIVRIYPGNKRDDKP